MISVVCYMLYIGNTYIMSEEWGSDIREQLSHSKGNTAGACSGAAGLYKRRNKCSKTRRHDMQPWSMQM